MTVSEGRRTVLVAGGTRGIGRAIGLAFAQSGARVVLTHRWGSADPDELRDQFGVAGGTEPEIVEADVAVESDTAALMEHLPSGVDVFVANVCVVGRGTGTVSRRDLRRSLDYSAWPLPRYLEAILRTSGALPRYVVATSSDGPDRFYPGYDYVAASKAVLEALCRSLAARHPDLCINVLRARQVDTTGYREMFGAGARDAVSRFSRFDLDPEEVAHAAVALCSGDLDGLSGQVVTVDRGAGPMDNLVNVAPVLLGGAAVWESDSAEPSKPRDRRVLWVDAGVRPDGADLCRPIDIVPLREAEELDPERIPESIVVGCDWREHRGEDIGPSEILPILLDRAAASGGLPRYGIRVDRGVEPSAPGEALARALDRYWGGWNVGKESRLNAVRYVEDRLRPRALDVVRALLSGRLDGLRDQLLPVTRGSTT
jgi:NAD(P)-dependent dehydrogenase (short-subunit alcohol dehydrogenase family)